ncbi:MAG: hypothetical protein GY820_19165 [Gammaproteobacteria bacterium]|nr:hypothetical protein [Gammaproteobacteria bacterium]
MYFKEIVCCYVSKIIPMPDDLPRLRKSFTENMFSEKEINPNKWQYKRGAALALEFNYNSEAIEMQVILESVGNKLRVSVGNWGFPFEPLMMKKRFQKNLDEITNQISKNGVLDHDRNKSQEINRLAQEKKRSAWVYIVCTVIAFTLYELYSRT